MKSGRLGPVLLEMPKEAMAVEYPAEDIAYTPVRIRRSVAASEDVRDLVAHLLKASRPVIAAGQGVLYAEASEELIAFAELTDIPVMTTLAGKSAFPETHPLALGTGGLTRPLMVGRFLDEADFVLGIGTSFTRNTFTTPMPDGVSLGASDELRRGYGQGLRCCRRRGRRCKIGFATVDRRGQAADRRGRTRYGCGGASCRCAR